MKLDEVCDKKLITRLKALNLDFKQKDLQFFETSLPVYKMEHQEAMNQITDSLIMVSTLYFGIHASQIQKDLILLATKKIITQFKEISIEEIIHSFDRLEIQRQVTLTIDDLIQPIKKYIFTKNYISGERIKILKEERQAEILEKEKIDYIKKCVLTYSESLKAGKWLGNTFEAIATAKEFKLSAFLDKNKVQNFWIEAKQEYFELKKAEQEDESNELKSFLQNLGKTAERIFAEKIVVECIKQKIEI